MATKKPATTLDFTAARNGTPDVPPVAEVVPPVVEAPVVATPEPAKKYVVNTAVKTRIDMIREVVRELLAEGPTPTRVDVQNRLPHHFPKGGDWGDKYTENNAKKVIEKETGGKPAAANKRGRKPGSKNKPVVAAKTTTAPKPTDTSDKMACIRWAIMEQIEGVENAEWVGVADVLERAWPGLKWRTQKNSKLFSNIVFQLTGLYNGPTLIRPTAPAPVEQAAPLAMHDIAGAVEIIQHMGDTFGWHQVNRLVGVLSKR